MTFAHVAVSLDITSVRLLTRCRLSDLRINHPVCYKCGDQLTASSCGARQRRLKSRHSAKSTIPPSQAVAFSLLLLFFLTRLGVIAKMRRNEASLNTGQPPGGVELGMLQSLRSYKSRLEYTYQYQPLQAVQQIASETALENAVGFFDTGLRHIISRDDLEDRVAGELSTGNPKALVYLQSLCKLLSQLVNIDLLSPDSILHNEPQDDPYSNFSALLKRLATSSWPFELVTGQKNKLFRLAEEPVAKDARDLVDKFNAFLDRFSRPSLSDMPPSQPVAPFTDGLEKEELRGRAITALSTLFSHIPLDCSVGHKVLVRLPDWDSMEPNRTGSSGALDLFLSTCDGSLDWQPTECHVWSPG